MGPFYPPIRLLSRKGEAIPGPYSGHESVYQQQIAPLADLCAASRDVHPQLADSEPEIAACGSREHRQQVARVGRAHGTALATKRTKPLQTRGSRLSAVGALAVVTIRIHVLEIVGVLILILLYLLFRTWRKI
jgi:hypothetical protein